MVKNNNVPEISKEAIGELKGEYNSNEGDLDWMSVYSICFSCLGIYFRNLFLVWISVFILLSMAIYSNNRAPLLSNSKISLILILVAVYLIYFKNIELFKSKY